MKNIILGLLVLINVVTTLATDRVDMLQFFAIWYSCLAGGLWICRKQS